MTKDIMEEREKALEDEFFHKQDQKKLEAMKGKLEAQATKEELRKWKASTGSTGSALPSSRP